jgi:glycerate dehydrogenase
METVVVSAQPRASRAIYADALADRCNLVFLADLPAAERTRALSSADILISLHLRQELSAADAALLTKVRFIQLLLAGVDHIPFSMLPRGVPIACTRGKAAPSMAEHVVALALACSRRILVEDRNMRAGQFNMYAPETRILAGGTCAILGFGGAGRAAARIFRAMGMRIHAIDRAGTPSEGTDFLGTLADLPRVLSEADVIVITLALTKATVGLIGAPELFWTKKDAILVNVSRAEIIDEGALYQHLVDNPRFSAGLDVWWTEPFRHGEFRTAYPLLDLQNVVASPHNSGQASNADLGLAESLENVRAVLAGEPPRMLVQEDEKLL